MELRTRIGVITSGSLVDGLAARLDGGRQIEDLRVGQFVVVRGERNEFFAMVTDVVLDSTNKKVLADPPDGDLFFHEVLAGTSTYGTVELRPMLMLPRDLNEGLRPPKTVPPHFAPVLEADESDITRVFGTEDEGRFEIGRPLDMDVPVCIDLGRLVERSNGVFGKSGTGKSFLTRLLLCGVIKAGKAANLIFDMHSEYGWDATTEDRGMVFVKGLSQLFQSKVQIYSLDPETSRKRGVRVDADVMIGLDQIEVEDIALLQDELNLTGTAAETAALLVDRYHDRWLKTLLTMDTEAIKAFAEETSAHAGAVTALKRKLEQVARLSFVHEKPPTDAIERLIENLAQGKHIVLEFGRHSSTLAYMLVANIITRRIHRRWVDQTQRFLNTKKESDRPQPLMITIEEAHKFLNPQVAKQTIFGTIAREMRKYSVTLLVVDQRPSSIDSEVLSQIGTRVTALLNDDKDIDAVFTGVSGGAQLRSVLSTLDTRQQAMVLGHAVPMPVVVRTRSYDEDFYRAMGARGVDTPAERRQAFDEVEDLF